MYMNTESEQFTTRTCTPKVYNSRLIHYIESGAGFFIKYGKQWTLGMQRFVDWSQRISKSHLTSFLQ